MRMLIGAIVLFLMGLSFTFMGVINLSLKKNGSVAVAYWSLGCACLLCTAALSNPSLPWQRTLPHRQQLFGWRCPTHKLIVCSALSVLALPQGAGEHRPVLHGPRAHGKS